MPGKTEPVLIQKMEFVQKGAKQQYKWLYNPRTTKQINAKTKFQCMLQYGPLTRNIRLQCFRHQAPGDFEVFSRALANLQATCHAHALQYLDVIMDLKRAVKVEEVLKPAGKHRRKKYKNAGVDETVNPLNQH